MQHLRLDSIARRANLQRLRDVPNDSWGRSGVQEGVGAVSLCDMPVFLWQHDRAHRGEIQQWERDVNAQ